jgi:hypothetical protein
MSDHDSYGKEENLKIFDEKFKKFYDSDELLDAAWTSWDGEHTEETKVCFISGALMMFRLLYDVVFSNVGYAGWRKTPAIFTDEIMKQFATERENFMGYCISQHANKRAYTQMQDAFTCGSSFVLFAARAWTRETTGPQFADRFSRLRVELSTLHRMMRKQLSETIKEFASGS